MSTSTTTSTSPLENAAYLLFTAGFLMNLAGATVESLDGSLISDIGILFLILSVPLFIAGLLTQHRQKKAHPDDIAQAPSSSPATTPPPSHLRTLTRILTIATTLFLGGGLLFYILGPLLNDSWKEMMLSSLALTCITIGILTALAGTLCDLLLKRRPPTTTQDPEQEREHPQSPGT